MVNNVKLISLFLCCWKTNFSVNVGYFLRLFGKYDDQVTPSLLMSQSTRTRGTTLKLETVRARFDRRKYSFNDRVVCIWNSLPQDIVTSVSINIFKMKLDSFWCCEPLLCDFKASLSCIGVRSIHRPTHR